MESSCTRRTLSGSPLYRAKMPSIATPVVHGNCSAARMPPNFMTALGGAGGGAKRPSRLRRTRNGAGSLSQAFRSLWVRFRQAFPYLKAPAAAEKSCTRQALSGRPFYRAKMPSIATPVVHGNRPAGRMPPNFMTALGGRGEAQSALLAFGGHETGPAVYRGLFSRSGYAFDRLSFEISLPTFGQDRK